MNDLGSNPYVGPRAFREDEKLYGRNQEKLRLLNLLIAERVVVLYSPSGAGKTSLIQAALIPELRKKKFRILGPMRVGLGLSQEEFPSLGENRYLSSLLASLDYHPLAGQQIPQNLAGCLEHLAKDTDPRPDEVLIFDQFEEILTLDLTDIEAKEAFFAQVGEVLKAPNIWALFSLREEYVAGLEPFARFIPTRFKNTFRLDLLSVEAAALEAIQIPAKEAGVVFTDDAAQKLAQDLGKVPVQQSDGSFVKQPGPTVEPVHLQVVCQRLWKNHQTRWEKLPSAQRKITEPDLDEFEDVDSALAGYYEEQVAEIASKHQVRERELREWFDCSLITPRGSRGQVLLAETNLNVDAIRDLVKVYLVREATRRGVVWVELAHDRLIEPVRKNNQIWFNKNLQPFQRQADLWKKMGYPSNGPYLSGRPLREAEQWTKTNYYQLQEEEKLFLDGCRKKRLIWWRGLLVGLFIFAASISILGLLYANHQAKNLNKLSLMHRKAYLAFADSSLDPERGTHLALQAIEGANTIKEESKLITSREVMEKTHQVLQLAEDALHRSMFACRLSEHHISDKKIPGWTPDKISMIFFSPDNRRFASLSLDSSVKIREAAPGKLPESIPVKDVNWAAFNQDGSRLAMACKDSKIKIWDVDKKTFITRDDGKELAFKIWDVNKKTFITRDTGEDSRHKSVLTIKFNKEGDCLAATGEREVNLWKSDTFEELKPFIHGDLQDFDFSPDGGYIATAGWDGQVFIRRIPSLKEPFWQIPPEKDFILIEHGKSLGRVAFSPTERLLVTISGDDGVVKLWDLSSPNFKEWKVVELDLNAGLEMAFSPDGKFLALTDKFDYQVYIFDVSIIRGKAETCGIEKKNVVFQKKEQKKTAIFKGATLLGHTGKVTQLLFLPLGDFPEFRFVVTASKDTTIKIWDIFWSKELFSLTGHQKPVKGIAVYPDNNLISVGWDGQMRLFDIGIGHTSSVNKVVFDIQGKWIATASSDGTARIWDTENRKELKRLGGYQKEQRINAIAFNPNPGKKPLFPDEEGLFFAGKGGDINFGTLHDVKKLGDCGPLTFRIDNMIFSPKYMAIQAVLMLSDDYYSKILVINTDEADSFKPIVTLPHGKNKDTKVCCLAISLDERYLAAGSSDGKITVWDLKNPKKSSQLTTDQGSPHQDRVLSLAFSKNGVLASTSADMAVKLWQSDNKHWTEIKLIDYPLFQNVIKTVAFSHDGNHLAAGSADQRVKIFKLDLESRNMHLEHEFSHSAGINDVAFSPDDKKLAVACDDNRWYIHALDIQDVVIQAKKKLEKWGNRHD